MLKLPLLRKQMESIDFFNDFKGEQKDFLASRESFFHEVASGDILIHEGDPERDLYVLLDGELEVMKEGMPEPIAVLKSGAVFGEISFFSRKRRSTSIRARDRAVVLKIPEDYFTELECDLQKTLMYKMVSLLVTRLEKMNVVMERIQELQMRAAHANR
ncbi:MAG: cyclic nucleotide-binding domain-containing protein [Magnetococcales bacterium]|nr:cyclic nucleotide-binding domain-containing protein [Magnetococcales bacterium]